MQPISNDIFTLARYKLFLVIFVVSENSKRGAKDYHPGAIYITLMYLRAEEIILLIIMAGIRSANYPVFRST